MIATIDKGNDPICYVSYGQNAPRYATSASAGAAPPNAAVADEGAKGATSVSTTNNQVASVDEADFVKNDNRYVYAVSGNLLSIVDAYPANTMKTLSRGELGGIGKKLFVEGDR